MDASFPEQVRDWLKVPWRAHAPLEIVTIRGRIIDGDVLVGKVATEAMHETESTFYGDEVQYGMIVTGLQAGGATVAVTLGGKTFKVTGDHRLDKPIVLGRGDKVHAVVRDDDPRGAVTLTLRGYEVLRDMVPDVKMIVAELYAS